MSEGLFRVVDAISAIGNAAVTASAALKQTLSDQQAANAVTKPGGAKLGSTTATNEGYGLPGEMIAALKLLEGRT
jgi:hypothetical protein